DVQLQSEGRNLDGVLAIPLIPSELRMNLLTNRRRISDKLNTEWVLQTRDSDRIVRPASQADEQHKSLIRLAAAILGDQQVESDFAAEKERLAQKWDALASTIDFVSTKSPAPESQLERAARLAGTGISPVAEPALDARKRRWTSMFLWLAKRS